MNNINPTHEYHFFSDMWHLAKQTYKTWFTYWWWLIGIRLIAGYFYPELNILSTPFLVAGFWHNGVTIFELTLSWIIATLLVLITYYSLYISAKPTIQSPNYLNFTSFMPHFIVLTLWFGIITLLYRSRDILQIIQIPENIAIVIVTIIGAIIGIFSLFFLAALFDSEKINIKESIFRAYKAIIHNIVLLLVISLLFAIGYTVAYIIISNVSILIIQNYFTNDMQTTTGAQISQYFYFSRALLTYFDFLLALPFLIISATSIYYKNKYHKID